MNLYIFTYFMIFIWIRVFYSQIFGVNFRFLGKNGDDWVKEEEYKRKRDSWKARECIKAPKKANFATKNLAQASSFSQRECLSDVFINRRLSRLSEIVSDKLSHFMFSSISKVLEDVWLILPFMIGSNLFKLVCIEVIS